MWFVIRCLTVIMLNIFGFLSAAGASININVDAVQKSVFFLYSADSGGVVDPARPLGTGFLAGIPLLSDPRRSYTFLVTARHMVDPAWAKCEQANPVVIYARLNLKSYDPKSGAPGTDFIRVELGSQDQQKWRHPDENDIDAAVVPIKIDQEKFDASFIPVTLFPTPEEIISQGIGDPVMSAGLLPSLGVRFRNYPIFKFGQISNIPKEDVAIICAQNAPESLVKVWLIAANLVSGNSGSPIFHVPLGGGGVVFGGTRPMLLGLQSISFLGADVAGMTPINYVYELLQNLGLPDADFRRGP